MNKEDNTIGAWVHHGVGYSGVDKDTQRNKHPRATHLGVGYGGLYE